MAFRPSVLPACPPCTPILALEDLALNRQRCLSGHTSSRALAVDMGGPEMAPHTPHTLGAPRRSRGTPRYSDWLLAPVALLDLAFGWGDRHAAQAGGADRGVDRPVLLGVLDEAPHVVGGERSRARRGHRMAADRKST